MTYTPLPPTPSHSCLFFSQKPKKPPPPSKHIRKEGFLPFSSLKSKGVASCLWSRIFSLWFLYMPSVANLVSKNCDELMSWLLSGAAETPVRLQIACFHLQIHRMWSGAQRIVLKLRLSLWQGHMNLHIYLHISRASRWHFTVWYSVDFWTCYYPSNEEKQRYFFCACVRELSFYTHTHTCNLPVCPSN